MRPCSCISVVGCTDGFECKSWLLNGSRDSILDNELLASTIIPITPYLRLFPPVTLFLGDSVQVKWPRSRGKTASSIFKWWLRCHTTMNAECSTKQAQLTSVIKLHNSGRYRYEDYYCYSSKRTKQCVHLTRCQFVGKLPDAYPILDHLALGWTYMKEHKVYHLPI